MILPIHPGQTILYGFILMLNEITAHDGNKFDHTDHYKHHLYYTVNFGDPIMDRYFGSPYDAVFIFIYYRKTFHIRQFVHMIKITKKEQSQYIRDICELFYLY